MFESSLLLLHGNNSLCANCHFLNHSCELSALRDSEGFFLCVIDFFMILESTVQRGLLS